MTYELGRFSSDPLRRMAETENPFPDSRAIEEAYREFRFELPFSSFRETPPTNEKIHDYDILLFDGSSAVVTPYGETTDPIGVFPYLALGQPAFEYPPESFGLNPKHLTSVIRSNGFRTDPNLRERLEEAAAQTMANSKRAAEYVESELPMATIWSATAAWDAMNRFNELTGGKVLNQNGRLLSEIAERTIIINADNGGGVASVSNLANNGVVFQESLPDSLSPTQTGFVASMIGAEKSLTVAAACAGFSEALHAAEIFAASNKSNIDLTIITSGFDGPTGLTQLGFDALGLPPSQALPYIGEEGIGYTETPGAIAMVFPTKKLAEQLGLPIAQGYLVRTVKNQGRSKMGVERRAEIEKGIPGATYDQAFQLLREYYPEEFSGSLLTLTHGAKTLGATLEKRILPYMRERHQIQGRIGVTSTQPILGHQYAPRGGFSLAYGLIANSEGVVWGMAPSNRDLTGFGEEENLQQLRRSKLEKARKSKTSMQPINFKNERSAEKAQRDFMELGASGVDIFFASRRIPRSAILATHQGLGGISQGVLLIPIGHSNR